MAIDEAILSTIVKRSSAPTLRFYAWSPPCLSLGRNQPLTDVDYAACHSAGISVVRRPTGGRAILHTDELTYSVVLPQTDPRAAGDVVQSYRQLSRGLLAGLHHMGVETAQAHDRRPKAAELTAVCFEMPSAYEITAHPTKTTGPREPPKTHGDRRPGTGSRKLVGSAQWRARGGVLQHGTLPLQGDITRIVDYLAFAEDEREEQRELLRQRATTLEEVLGRSVPFEEAALNMAHGFSQALNLTLTPGSLTAREHALVAQYRDRYAVSGLPKSA
jgi:lipoate-protein ligase A